MAGTELAGNGYLLGEVGAPAVIGEEGTLSFVLRDPQGAPLTDYQRQHGKELHLIVVRSDGAHFRHVHPVLDTTSGTWSLPWSWDAAGSYRLFADFSPSGGEPLTLSHLVEVGGQYAPAPATGPVTSTSVGGFDVSISGELVGGGMGDVSIRVERGGHPVTTLEPYLGAFGHLVALRDGDLAYLHIHPHGDEPSEGDTSGPTVDFMAHTPTAGRYLLYFDFQVGGQVHSAHLVLDAASGAPGGAAHHGSHNDHGDHGGHEPGGHDSHGGGHDVHGMH